MAVRTDWTKFRATYSRELAAGKTVDEAKKIANAEREADMAARQKKLEATKAKKAAQAKTCQICGRPIFAELGLIAHHGYERPGMGYQTASCEGARHLPFEVSKDVLVDHIVAMKNRLRNMRRHRDSVAAEKVPFDRTYEVPEKDANGELIFVFGRRKMKSISFTMTRETFVQSLKDHPEAFRHQDAKYVTPFWHDGKPNEWFNADEGFEHFLQKELTKLGLHISNLTAYINKQELRRDGWKQTQRWDAKKKVWKL